MILYFAVIAGAFLSLLFGLNEGLAKQDFKVSIFFRQNLISTLLNIVCGCILVMVKDEIINVISINTITALVLGMSGQFVFKKITKVFDPQSPTLLGAKKKLV
ncbi:MAG TPA: hypothetical protein VMV77_04790 [Bacteroidales bacterium]|nr:hypothetical protein [Bacteroidales bacterium]